MGLVNSDLGGWSLNAINQGPPFRVAIVGPFRLAQVEDSRGVCALSGPNGAVFCASRDQAERLCALANEGSLK